MATGRLRLEFRVKGVEQMSERLRVLERRAACRAQHTGEYAMEPRRLHDEVALIKMGLYKGVEKYAYLRREQQLVEIAARRDVALDLLDVTNGTPDPATQSEDVTPKASADSRPVDPLDYMQDEGYNPSTSAPVRSGPARARERNTRLFDMASGGIAVIVVSGIMGKGDSKFFDVNTVRVRMALRQAVEDSAVKGIMLVIDSPGGTVAGTAELADDVIEARKVKPVRVHADDMLASAAFWVAASSEWITAGRTTEVGSIGTLSVVEDRSKEFDEAGIVVHVISTGEMKGAFVEGTEVTEPQLEMLRKRVAELNVHFLAAVKKGRSLSPKRLQAVTDGRVWLAAEAQSLGLIDAVQTYEVAREAFEKTLRAQSRLRGARAQIAAVGLELELRAAAPCPGFEPATNGL